MKCINRICLFSEGDWLSNTIGPLHLMMNLMRSLGSVRAPANFYWKHLVDRCGSKSICKLICFQMDMCRQHSELSSAPSRRLPVERLQNFLIANSVIFGMSGAKFFFFARRLPVELDKCASTRLATQRNEMSSDKMRLITSRPTTIICIFLFDNLSLLNKPPINTCSRVCLPLTHLANGIRRRNLHTRYVDQSIFQHDRYC